MAEISTTTISAPPLPPKQRSKVTIKQDALPTRSTVFISSPPDDTTYSISSLQVQGQGNISDTGHVVKIIINPTEPKNNETNQTKTSIVHLESKTSEYENTQARNSENYEGCIRINVGNTDNEEMIQNNTAETFLKSPERNNPYFFYSAFPTNNMVMSSGQCSPSDTLDSGTCSDMDSTPPPLPKKKSVTVTVIGAQHKRVNSLGENDSDIESNISCDSLNSSDLNEDCKISTKSSSPAFSPILNETSVLSADFQKFALGEIQDDTQICEKTGILEEFEKCNISNDKGLIPQGLLKDIRDISLKLTTASGPDIANGDITVEHRSTVEENTSSNVRSLPIVDESTYEERQNEKKQNEINKSDCFYEADKFYKFHLNENVIEEAKKVVKNEDDELFAGYKDVLGSGSSSTIRSSKGTIRGVKNRVRAGIATFLQINTTNKVRFFYFFVGFTFTCYVIMF